MTYDLVIGDRAYSSWSLRGWLLFDAFGLPVKLHTARLYTDELPTLLKQFHPGKTAPTMRTPDGVVVPETIAIQRNWPVGTLRPGSGPQTPRRGRWRGCWRRKCMRGLVRCAAIAR